MLGKKKLVNRQIVGFTKPRKILFFRIKPKPIYKIVEMESVVQAAAPSAPAGTTQPVQQPQQQMQHEQAAAQQTSAVGTTKQAKQATRAKAAGRGVSQSAMAAKRNAQLAMALPIAGIKQTPEQYVASSKKKAMAIGAVATIGSFIALYEVFAQLLILVPLVGIIGYMMSFNTIVSYPMKKADNNGLEVEKDILFAARDMIVSMRSGMPLFNSMATVSIGYGAASKEFEKVIDRVQLGMPMEQAMDEVTATSKSPTFRRLMLQASTSIKVGADIINAIQEVISDVSQERVIELSRYGQKLNAIAMFYMLFGVIFPSMGLAVAAIMSTFISFFPITNTTLMLAAVGIIFLQFVFLRMVSGSRPSFST